MEEKTKGRSGLRRRLPKLSHSVFRDGSYEFVDRALTIEQKTLESNHYFTLNRGRNVHVCLVETDSACTRNFR